MLFFSTRGNSEPKTFSETLLQSLASDGGLYIPESFPQFDFRDFQGLGYSSAAIKILSPFLEGDQLSKELPQICSTAFNFPVPLVELRDSTSVLELFHGPSAAFKDFGARFLSSCLRFLDPTVEKQILVATSGDTGGAVAAAFFEVPNIKVKILFPKGRVSARQEKQLTSWGKNVSALAVQGDFDDCQKMVKQALQDKKCKAPGVVFVSANSISLGRLLPQVVYYATACTEYFTKNGAVPGVIVPTGNLGNAVGALWAKKLGFPIRHVILATNANRTIEDFLTSGNWQPHPTVATLANAMDVGNPSNIERVRALYLNISDLRKDVSAISVNDEEIRQTISDGPKIWGQIWCPHTATAIFARQKRKDPNWIVVATAHPAKFETIVEPLIGQEIEVPKALAEILARPSGGWGRGRGRRQMHR